jgi:16S rRNA C967 or C1407 C5-methylase (RsmB/RsmF family)/NOL1/NOP2/fmu family ribosome biogenesis protein
MQNLPPDFLIRARQFAGEDYNAFIECLSLKPVTSVRINPYKREGIFSGDEKISWSKEGRYLSERPSFTLDPLFHAGSYYVQDASSQFLEQPVLQIKKMINRPLRVLDLCAAPGGKSTHLLSLLDDKDLLVSNEIVAGRNNILRQNIIKWGRANVVVTQNDPADIARLENFFDVVIVDAPCSGEGLFRKDEDARDEWSLENIKRCSIRQQEILKHAYKALSPGGYLIYSTCTFEEEENDKAIEMLIDNYEMEHIPIVHDFEGIKRTRLGVIFFPHMVKGEGFYLAMVKKQNGVTTPVKKVKDNNDILNKKYLGRYLKEPEKYFCLIKEDRLFAIPLDHSESVFTLGRYLYVRLAGIYVGDFKGDDFIPSSALALSTNLKKDLPVRELTLEQAIAYLSGGNLLLDIEKGWSLVSYHGFNLGWVKNLGTRINNYYPKEWRIRKLVN